MGVGKQIIAAMDGEAKRVIEEAECGFCCCAEDEKLLPSSIMRFKRSSFSSSFAKRAEEYYYSFFSKAAFLEKLQNEMIVTND